MKEVFEGDEGLSRIFAKTPYSLYVAFGNGVKLAVSKDYGPMVLATFHDARSRASIRFSPGHPDFSITSNSGNAEGLVESALAAWEKGEWNIVD